MNCTECSTKLKTIDSRPMNDVSRWRKYKCYQCGETYQTIEYLNGDVFIKSLQDEIKRLKGVLNEIKTLSTTSKE